ncbi:MAG: sodium:alanine symporter family protein [Rickettsiales bacterium]|nr:sodium:alanine symporter family protein [Rickettsiales bacterium]
MKYLFFFVIVIFSNNLLADDLSSSSSLTLDELLVTIFQPFVNFLASIFFFDIMGFPIIVLWLITGSIFFTIYLKFVNLRLFTHAIDVVKGKYSNPNDPGKVTHAQALFTAVAATVGLGNIAGVAIAITLGGPGAVIWMMIAAFFGMTAKYSEVLLGLKYRQISKDNHLFSGPFYYLRDGLKDIGHAKLGKILSIIAAIFCIFGAIGAGILFQSNQAVEIISSEFNLGSLGQFVIVIILASIIGFVLIGGVVRIANIAEKIVPFMAIIYVISCLTIILVNHSHVYEGVRLMFLSAFSENSAIYGGVIGAIIQGVKRSAFSNEAGIGSATIAHGAAKTKEPVREGAVAILEPFIDTIIICFMTGLVITITGAYIGSDGLGGVLITAKAFATVSNSFSTLLSFIVLLFAFSTMLTYCYYGRQAWDFLSKGKYENVCYSIFIFFVVLGGMLNLGIVIDLADILFLSMSIPNLIGLYLLAPIIKKETKIYIKKLKAGEFKKVKNL